MTIAELKESIEKMRVKEPDDLGKAYNNGLDFCLEMIKVYEKFREDEQALSQEPCNDAVSRQAVLALPRIKIHNEWGNVIKESVDVEDVKQLPSVTQKSGHWIEHEHLYKCSVCGEISCCHGRFCNECGAKMVEPQESEDKG